MREVENFKTVTISNNFGHDISEIINDPTPAATNSLADVNTLLSEMVTEINNAINSLVTTFNDTYLVNFNFTGIIYTDIGPTDPPDVAELQGAFTAIANDIFTVFNQFISYVNTVILNSNICVTLIPPITLPALPNIPDNTVNSINTAVIDFLDEVQPDLKINLFGNCQFSQAINLEFQPDEVSCHFFSINNVDYINCQRMLALSSDLIDGTILNKNILVFPSYEIFSETVNIPFKISRPIQGDFNFYIRTPSGLLPSNNQSFQLNLSVTLVFIKYKQKSH